MTRVALLGVLLVPSLAHADGFEHPDNGTRAMGRAGAFAARADDGSAIQYNLAALAGQRGTRLSVQATFHDPSLCFNRLGAYNLRDAGGVDLRGRDYPRICDESSFLDNPQPVLAISTDLGNPDLPVFFFGIYGPNSPKWARYSDEVELADGTMAPSPNRYDLVNRELVVLFPTLGAAYELLPWLRLGAAFQATFAHLKFANVVTVAGSEEPSTDFLTDLDTIDWFTPAGVFSAQVRLRPIDLGVTLRLPGDFDADGDVQFSRTRFTDPTLLQPKSDASVHAPQNSALRVGARFFWARPGAEDRKWAEWDALRDELFDVEADIVWEGNSAFDQLDIEIASDRLDFGAGLGEVEVADPVVPHHWKDTIGYRVGGDFNAVPERLALRAGVSYEPGASPPNYSRIDFLAFRRTGLYLGATYRLAGIDLSLAFGHVIGTPRNVRNGDTHPIGPSGPVTGVVVTDGRYETSMTSLSVGADFRF